MALSIYSSPTEKEAVHQAKCAKCFKTGTLFPETERFTIGIGAIRSKKLSITFYP